MVEKKGKSKRKEPLPEVRAIDMPPKDYQPNKAEQEAEIDMPGADIKTVRSAFFRPILGKVKKSS